MRQQIGAFDSLLGLEIGSNFAILVEHVTSLFLEILTPFRAAIKEVKTKMPRLIRVLGDHLG